MRTMTTSSSSSVKPLARPARDFSCSLSVPPGPCGPRNINAGLQASASFEITSTTRRTTGGFPPRSEEHTSELQSRLHLVCRLLLEKKKKKHTNMQYCSYRRDIEAA